MCICRKRLGVAKTRIKKPSNKAAVGQPCPCLVNLFFFFFRKRMPLLYDSSMFTLRDFPVQTQGPKLNPSGKKWRILTEARGCTELHEHSSR